MRSLLVTSPALVERSLTLALRMIGAVRLPVAGALSRLLVVERSLSDQLSERRLKLWAVSPQQEPPVDSARLLRSIRCAEMAAICGVRQATISRWESGHSDPNLEQLERIRAEALRRGLAWSDSWFFEELAA